MYCQYSLPSCKVYLYFDFLLPKALWFPLLETMMAPQQKLKDKVDKKHREGKFRLILHLFKVKNLHLVLIGLLRGVRRLVSSSYNMF